MNTRERPETPLPAIQWTPKENVLDRAERELAGLARALGHPHRVRILRLVSERGSCTCGDLVELLPIAQATVSQHLKVLRETGLLEEAGPGSRPAYRLGAPALVRLRGLIRSL